MQLEFCNLLFKFCFLFHQCDCSANADIMTTFLFRWSRKPSSSYSSRHSKEHNHTAVNEKKPLEFRNLNFKVQFLFHQFVCHANADIAL